MTQPTVVLGLLEPSTHCTLDLLRFKPGTIAVGLVLLTGRVYTYACPVLAAIYRNTVVLPWVLLLAA